METTQRIENLDKSLRELGSLVREMAKKLDEVLERQEFQDKYVKMLEKHSEILQRKSQK